MALRCSSSGNRPGPRPGLLVLAVVLVAVTTGVGAEAGQTEQKPNAIPSTNALSFMRRFGYLEQGRPDSETLYTEEAVVEAIKLVQRFGAIPQTGVLDAATEKLMTARRCGCPDVVRRPDHDVHGVHGVHGPHPHEHRHGDAHRDRRRHKRFVVASNGWKKRHLRYYIANWTPKIGEDGVNAQMVKAFDAWSQYGRLRFTRASRPDEADITVAFGRGSHGDWFPFDGPGGILAHAFYPYEMATYGGDIHFDDDEQWAANPNSTELYNGAVDLFLVAVHELGHSLGLGHSPDPGSIMFPYYQSKSDSFALGQDDILGMYELYIKRQLDEDNETPDYASEAPPPRPTRPTTTTSTTPRPVRTTTRRPRPPPRPRPTTTTTSTTTTTTTPRPRRPPPQRPHNPGGTPTFTGDDESVEEHKKHDDKHGIPPNPPAPEGPVVVGSTDVSADDNEVPDLCSGNYNAVAQLRGELFVFKGQYLWRFRRPGEVMQGYPVPLQRMFRDLPASSVDAVYQREDGNIVLFSGPRYWVYNGVSFVENSPQHIARYGLPHNTDRIDAVMIWAKNGATYFFRKSEFWRYNTTTSRMDPGYPKKISVSWKGVPNQIDDAMTWTDGVSHFFKGELYYTINNKNVRVERRESAPQFWFGCS